MQTTEALSFGRRTWQVMAGAWPDRAGDPFADRMNEIPKYVASRTLGQEDLTWPTPLCCLRTHARAGVDLHVEHRRAHLQLPASSA